jgi:hypothetical protein
MSVAACVVVKSPDDLTHVVDAVGPRNVCPGHVDLGEAAAAVEEAMDVARLPDDLPRVVDAVGVRVGKSGHVDGGQAPAAVEETMGCGADGQKRPDDLTHAVDAVGVRIGAGHGDLGEAPAAVEETEDQTVALCKMADYLSRVVDSGGHGSYCAGHVDLAEAAAGVEETMVARAKSGGICGNVGRKLTANSHRRREDCSRVRDLDQRLSRVYSEDCHSSLPPRWSRTGNRCAPPQTNKAYCPWLIGESALILVNRTLAKAGQVARMRRWVLGAGVR